MTDKPMTVGDLKETIKNFPDDLPIHFECSCSRRGGYDGWKVEIELGFRDSFLDFRLQGYHEDD